MIKMSNPIISFILLVKLFNSTLASNTFDLPNKLSNLAIILFSKTRSDIIMISIINNPEILVLIVLVDPFK